MKIYWIEILFWIAFAIVFYTYIGYGIVLYIMVKIKELFTGKISKNISSDIPSEVTLFITAYNEEDVIEEKMINSLALDYPSELLKIVWVTDGSTDKTNEFLNNNWKDNVTILFDAQRKGKTAAINRGMQYITSPIIVFTDANTMLNKLAIKEIVASFNNPKVGCVAGEKRIFNKSENDAASGGEGLYWKYESTLKALDSRLYSAVGAAGELFAIRKELFKSMPEDTLLDDFILSLQIAMNGYKIDYCSDAYAIESGSADMHEEEKRKIRIAAGGLQSIWRLRPLLNPFKYGILNFQYISHRVLRWSITPICLFMLLPLNFILVYTTNNLFYFIILMLQLLFYILGYWGYYLSTKQIKNKILFVPYYFLFMNLNVIKGFNYLLKKNKGVGTWEKSKRA